MESSLLQAFGVLGLKRRGKRWGPCPNCGQRKDSSHGAPVKVDRGLWFCHHCRVGGDAISAASCHLGYGPKPSGYQFLQAKRLLGSDAPASTPDPEPVTPRYVDVRPALTSATSLSSHLREAQDSDQVLRFCQKRAITPAAPAGVLGPFTSRWWPWRGTYPLVVPAFDGRGRLRSMHGRAVCDSAPRKSTWPAHADATELLFLDPKWARPWARGGTAPSIIIIAEGLTDYLTAAAQAPTIGIEAGSAPALRLLDVPKTTRVYMAVHDDEAGYEYARKVNEALRHRVYRLPIPRVNEIG